MITVKDNHLEWALKHLQRYSHSDFYPKIFEFAAISHNWSEVKDYILSIDLDDYYPKSPMINLAPKPNGNYRIAHQLDPVDSLIYTALIHEISAVVENYRIPESDNNVFSYRIKPDLEGSFFPSDTGWDAFRSRSEELAEKYKSGYVIVADITDFYNQIYTHRIQNLIEEAGKGLYDEQARVIENFLSGLNKKTSRGIPVGPVPSIILAELIMASIDNKIRNYTKDFVRYVDDIFIFFEKREDAVFALHELTQYLYSYHRLVFSGEKTKVRSVKWYREEFLKDEEKEENAALMAQADEFAREKIDELLDYVGPYEVFDYDEQYEKALSEVMDEQKFEILSSTYYKLFEKSISFPVNFVLIRHILRKSTRYRIRNLVSLVLDNFEILLPVIREVIIYLKAIMNEEIVNKYREQFASILSAHYMRLPFVNLWISYLLQNRNFNKIDLPSGYDIVFSTRGKALIALRREDTTWVRDFRDGMDVLGPWDRRAVLFSSSLLSLDEMKPWIYAVAASGDVIDKSISSYLVSQKKTHK